MLVHSLIVEQLNLDGTLKTFRMRSSPKYGEITVAFVDEYEEPREGPFYFLDKNYTQSYIEGFAECEARRLGKKYFRCLEASYEISISSYNKKSATGTYFNKANLTKSKFTDAVLKGTDFSDAILTYVDWNRANLGTNISEAKFSIDPKIIRLCASRNGKNKDYCDMDLSNLNLIGVDLTNANLAGADLSRSLLHKANLQYSNLSEAQAIATDFYKAILTGVCIKNWGISPDTNFTDVQCDYIYLELEQKERRPHEGYFKTGEFNDVFQKTFETVDLIFRNGIDWDAFAYSFKKLEVENQGAQLDVQSIEKKGDGILVVRVAVSPDADKAKIHSEFIQSYEFAAKALEAQYQARLEDKDTLISKQEAQINRLFDIVEQQGSVQKALAENPRKVSNYNMQNPQFGGGIVDAINVNTEQVGGNIQNIDNQETPG